MNKYLNEFIEQSGNRYDKWQTEIIREFDIELNKLVNKKSVLSSDIFLLTLTKSNYTLIPEIPEYKQGIFDFDMFIPLDDIYDFDFEHFTKKFLDINLMILRDKKIKFKYHRGDDAGRVLWKRFYLTPPRPIVPIHST